MKKTELKKLKTKLPKYPNILGRDRFFNSAVLIPIVKHKKNTIYYFKKEQNI